MIKHTTPILNQLMRIAICCGLVMSCLGCSHQTAEPNSAADIPTNTSESSENAASDASNSAGDTDIHAKNEELLHAAAKGKADRVRALITEGADVNAKDSNGFPVLEVAAAFDRAEVVGILIESGADVNIVSDASNRTPIFAFAIKGTDNPNHEAQALSIVKMLIEAKADVNFKTPDGVTALEKAVALGYSTIAKTLIAAGADVNAQDRMNFSPLHVAAMQHKLKALEVLIKAGADVNAVVSEEYHRDSALLLAANTSTKLKKSCKSVKDIDGAYDCLQARDLLSDFSDGMKLLLDAGADPNLANSRGITPLMLASKSGYLEGVKALLKAGADAKTLNKHHNTALHYVADCLAEEEICVSIAELIIDAGADINIQDGDGDTALIIAAKYNHKLLANLFLYAGSDPKVKNNEGQSAESFK